MHEACDQIAKIQAEAKIKMDAFFALHENLAVKPASYNFRDYTYKKAKLDTSQPEGESSSKLVDKQTQTEISGDSFDDEGISFTPMGCIIT